MGVSGQRHAPAALPLGKTRNPLCRKLGGPQGRSGQMREISPPTGIRSPDKSSSAFPNNSLDYVSSLLTASLYIYSNWRLLQSIEYCSTCKNFSNTWEMKSEVENWIRLPQVVPTVPLPASMNASDEIVYKQSKYQDFFKDIVEIVLADWHITVIPRFCIWIIGLRFCAQSSAYW